MQKTGFTTTILHSDRLRKPEHGSLHQPIHTSVAFGYENVRDLVDVFQGKQAGFAYARQNNPTIKALEEKITKLEDGVASVAFSTGMSAISLTFLALLRKGDHIISSSFLFGNTNSVLNTLVAQGIEVTFVDATSIENVQNAYQENTKTVLVETIANPVTQIVDLEGIGAFCEEKSLVYIVDNTMTSPYLFQPKKVKASLVVSSMTKYIAGHGNALGGIVTDTGVFPWEKFSNIYDSYKNVDSKLWGVTQIRKKGLRDFGAALSPEAAHHISVGSETLALRMERSCSNAFKLAKFFQNHPKIKKVNYPGLEDHPQHETAKSLFRHFGALLSFELSDDLDCFDVLNKLNVAISATNLGDNRTLVIPVAHTIFHEAGAEKRAEMGIADSLVRLSLGIEDYEDLENDFSAALK
ncbi:MAG: O-acetylhomoserine (thiol)-lyase [bacterium]|jgi:O-acetylhomoserine (thiol)-lyase